MSYQVTRWAVLCMIIANLSLYGVKTEKKPIFNQPVDIVYLWVDGNDPEWQAIKNHYLALMNIKSGGASTDGYTDNRFANNDELRYSLRSIWRYAPFINHIYIVTMNQRPAWLAPHPMITIVDHTQIFNDQSNLPTFNSQALESNLHRIPGLGEYFIYFNDDVFLGCPVTPAHFFTPTGKIKVLFSKSLSPSEPLKPEEMGNMHAATAYRNAWRNTNAFLDAHFQKEPRYRLRHAPFALRRSFIEMAECEFPALFASNSSHKFRSDSDFNMTNGLLQYYLVYRKKVVPGSLTNRMVSLRGDMSLDRAVCDLTLLKESRFQTFCIQDVMGFDSAQTKQLLRQFFQDYYPDPAPWEKI